VSTDYRKQLALLLFVAALLLAAGLGMRDPWPADEPRFALIARDMAANGNWLFPSVGGALYPDKPPVFFWLGAVFYLLTGSVRLSFLMPGLVAGLGTLYLTTDLARRLWGPQTAIFCGATLLAMLQFPLQMKSGQIDGLLCLWTTLSLYGFCRHLLLGPDWRWFALGGLSAGIGVITKGVGFLPFLIFIPYVVAAHKSWPVLRHSWRDPRWLLAIIAALLAISVWLIPMLVVANGSGDPDLLAYRDNILFHQTVTRYANSWGHFKPPWYLITNAASWLWLPVTALLPWLLPAWRRDLRDKNAAVLLLGSWILLVLIFFSISAGKRSLYIFPAAPALALIAGLHARTLLHSDGAQRVLLILPTLIASLLAALGTYVLIKPQKLDRWLTDIPTINGIAIALIGVGITMLAIIAFYRQRHVLKSFSVSMFAFWVGISVLVAPPMSDTRSGAALMQAVDVQVDSDMELGFVAWPEQFLLHWPHPAYHFGYRREPGGELRDASEWLAASDKRRLLLPDELIEPCFVPQRLVTISIAHRRTWVLADRAALSGRCDTGGDPHNLVKYSPRAR